ncbi:MAG: acetyl-CoA carboxylase biotin carboxyl carrier protein [Nitrospiraceae bacterium]|nr:MAG: acetyl-CoA carboxylase biotin carboxyl carrier protein [Nitrospiraceae bacterium]
MELDEIKKLIDLIKETDVTELSIERDGSKIKIKREKYLAAAEMVTSVPHHAASAEEKAPDDLMLAKITSPIVGIFHRAPSPESPPFVEVGSTVRKGQVLCIVEAMKLMNEIESDTHGIVSKILVENGHPVEYGEPLFLIEPST